ncbi:hypothetical protein TNCT_515141 [Trichonephila clavata]|uniref:Uncharacterized protein n=1 Tax=Trichonephila clavata TaxID=2740835 RepID=A0A8X6JQX3_TRICU|nr:hypothetical protein TNCT_394161 [Trichonephila clavata]GFR16296.1 hypothetical protein TNCT_515141 [Trichonephila clavata]
MERLTYESFDRNRVMCTQLNVNWRTSNCLSGFIWTECSKSMDTGHRLLYEVCRIDELRYRIIYGCGYLGN